MKVLLSPLVFWRLSVSIGGRSTFRSGAVQIMKSTGLQRKLKEKEKKGEVCVYFGIFHQITPLCSVSSENVSSSPLLSSPPFLHLLASSSPASSPVSLKYLPISTLVTHPSPRK